MLSGLPLCTNGRVNGNGSNRPPVPWVESSPFRNWVEWTWVDLEKCQVQGRQHIDFDPSPFDLSQFDLSYSTKRVDLFHSTHFMQTQMADPLSVQLLAFNFASQTLAYQRLARGLNRSVTGFSAFVGNYLVPCLSANVCTQFMDDIGCGVESPEQLLPYLRHIFQCLRRSVLKLSPTKCVFGSQQVSFLGNVITKEGLKPEKEKIEKFLITLEIPKSVKQVKRLIAFLQFFRNFIPNLNEHLIPSYKLLRKNVAFEVTEEILDSFKTLKEKLKTTATQTLRLAKPGLQYVILCDASYHSSGFVNKYVYPNTC